MCKGNDSNTGSFHTKADKGSLSYNAPYSVSNVSKYYAFPDTLFTEIQIPGVYSP